LILLVQGAALLLVPQRTLRLALVVGGAVAIAAMLVAVVVIPPAGEGANIGAGVLFLWLLVALGLVAAARRGDDTRPAARLERLSTSSWSKAALASLLVTLVYPPFALVTVAATAVAWWREAQSRVRTAATWLSAVAVAYAGLYFVVES
jgi:hypothetical protein